MNKQRRKYNKIEKKENELKPIQKPIFLTNHIDLKKKYSYSFFLFFVDFRFKACTKNCI